MLWHQNECGFIVRHRRVWKSDILLLAASWKLLRFDIPEWHQDSRRPLFPRLLLLKLTKQLVRNQVIQPNQEWSSLWRMTHLNKHLITWLHKSTLGKVLYLFRHCSAKQERLSLGLSYIGKENSIITEQDVWQGYQIWIQVMFTLK